MREDGLATVIPHSKPTNFAGVKAFEMLFGTKVVFAGDDPVGDVGLRGVRYRHPGVLLHVGDSLLTAHHRGELNPTFGDLRLNGKDKYWEYLFVRSVDPVRMAETVLASDLVSDMFNNAELETLEAARGSVMGMMLGGRTPSTQDISNVQKYLSTLYSHIARRFRGENTFIKPVEGCCSADAKGQLITTQRCDPEKMGSHFCKASHRLSNGRLPREVTTKREQRKGMEKALLSGEDNIVMTVYDLVMHPNKVMFQKGIKLAKTKSGVPLEFRVETTRGNPLVSNLRYWKEFDYYPEEAEGALAAVKDFFQRAPSNRQLTCGMDVAKGKDGNWYFIEFNPGMESGFLNPGIQWNTYLTQLTGETTPLMTNFQMMKSRGNLPQQRLFLQSLPDTTLGHPEINDVQNVYRFWRDETCDQLRRAGATAKRRSTMKDYLTKVFSHPPQDVKGDIQPLITAAIAFAKRHQID
jgi:hypothetical protein